MAASAEHQFIAETIGTILTNYAESALFGLSESQRRTFDYSCILLQDLSRPLVSQVLWSHTEGIEKDVRTLLMDADSLVKLYLVKDDLKVRATLDEIFQSYRQEASLKKALGGLRVIFLPPGFDADRVAHQQWMARHIQQAISKDILFGIVFGKLTRFDVNVFSDHGGPLGLKYLVLDEIAKQPITHMPTFKKNIGYATTGPIREAITMLNAVGMIRRYPQTNCCFATVKGRLYLDLIRRLLLELTSRNGWSDAALSVLAALDFPPPSFNKDANPHGKHDQVVSETLQAGFAKKQFGRDLLDGIDSQNPKLYGEYSFRDWEQVSRIPGFSASYLSEPESLFFVEEPKV